MQPVSYCTLCKWRNADIFPLCFYSWQRAYHYLCWCLMQVDQTESQKTFLFTLIFRQILEYLSGGYVSLSIELLPWVKSILLRNLLLAVTCHFHSQEQSKGNYILFFLLQMQRYFICHWSQTYRQTLCKDKIVFFLNSSACQISSCNDVIIVRRHL